MRCVVVGACSEAAPHVVAQLDPLCWLLLHINLCVPMCCVPLGALHVCSCCSSPCRHQPNTLGRISTQVLLLDWQLLAACKRARCGLNFLWRSHSCCVSGHKVTVLFVVFAGGSFGVCGWGACHGRMCGVGCSVLWLREAALSEEGMCGRGLGVCMRVVCSPTAWAVLSGSIAATSCKHSCLAHACAAVISYVWTG